MVKKSSVVPRLRGAATKDTPHNVKLADKTYAQAYKKNVAKPKPVKSSYSESSMKRGDEMIKEENERRSKQFMKSKKVTKK